MSTDLEREAGTIGPEVIPLGEVPMVRQECWEEIRCLWVEERVPVAEIARRFELDRKTVRRCLRGTAWQPYQRPARLVLGEPPPGLILESPFLSVRAMVNRTVPGSGSCSRAASTPSAASEPCS